MDPLKLLLDTLVTGLPTIPIFVGIYLLFRVLNEFDLTVEGSFTLGGSTAAVLILAGVPAPLALLGAVAAGAVAGIVTSTLHFTLGMPIMLGGLLMSLALFSINLRIMGQPSLSLLDAPTLFAPFRDLDPLQKDLSTIGALSAVIGVALTALVLYLKTDAGLGMRASGMNQLMARAQGVDPRRVVTVGLAGANGLAALGGSLMVQNQGFVEVNMGAGNLVAGAGALILGELLFRPSLSRVGRAVLSVAVGSLLYRFVLVFALRAGLPATDLKLVTALTLVLAFVAQAFGKKVTGRFRALVRPAPDNPRSTFRSEEVASDARAS